MPDAVIPQLCGRLSLGTWTFDVTQHGLDPSTRPLNVVPGDTKSYQRLFTKNILPISGATIRLRRLVYNPTPSARIGLRMAIPLQNRTEARTSPSSPQHWAEKKNPCVCS